MSENHKKLLELIQDNQVRIIAVIGTPRSGSTVVAKALAQVCDVALDGPFTVATELVASSRPNFGDKRLGINDESVYDAFCGLILDQISKKPRDQKPLDVVVKGTSGHMTPGIYGEWIKLPSSFLVAYRDPCKQFISYAITAYVDSSSGGQTPQIADFVRNTLPEIEEKLFPRLKANLQDANQYRWDAIVQEIDLIRSAAKIRGSAARAPYIIFLESTFMRFDPHNAWTNVLQRLGTASENIHYLLGNSWMADFGVQSLRSSAFKARVSGSRSISPLVAAESVDIETLPPKSQRHVQGLWPIYERLLAADENAYLPSAADVLQKECYDSDSRTLLDIDPPVAHELLAFYAGRSTLGPAPGSEDTESGVFTGPEVSHRKAKIYTRVQA